MQSILFVELLGGIGDVLIALPAIQALGRAHPNAKLTVLTFATGGDLIKNDPLIHQVLCLQQHTPHQVKTVVETLLERDRFDLIVSDTNYDGIEQVIQQSGTPQIVTNLWRSPPPNQPVGDRFLHILQAEGLLSPDDIAPVQLHLTPAARDRAQQRLGTVAYPLVILYPDAGMAIKRWSPANVVQVGRVLQQQYNATIVVPIGSNPELSEQMVRAIGGTATVWAQGTLQELAALMATATLVIAPDTGSARIAAALHTPTITLFGPSWHERYGQPAPHINLQGDPDCPERDISNFTTQRCWYSGECPFDRWQTCLDAIAPADVLAAAAPFLQPSTSSIGRSTPDPQPSSLAPKHSTTELTHAISEDSPPSAKLTPAISEIDPLSLELTPALSEVSPPSSELTHAISEDSSLTLELTPAISAVSPPSSELTPTISEIDLLSLELTHSTSALKPFNLEPHPTPHTVRLSVHAEAPHPTPHTPHPTPHPWQQWSSTRNLLVIRLDNIGDVLMTSPALHAIKAALPAARLTLMASPGGSQAAALLPWVDEVLPHRALWQDLGKLDFDPDREQAFIQTLRDRQFDAAIIFTSFSQTPHPAGYLCYLAGIPLRLGQSKEWGGAVLTTEVKAGLDTTHQVERNLRLIEAVGFPVSDRSLQIQIPTADQHRATAKLCEHGLNSTQPYILLNPWTSCQSRNYPADRLALAARQLATETGYRLVVTGVANDRTHSAPLLKTLGAAATDLIGHTTLAELAALIANAALMISNNTSTMHLADATRTPSVILFAGTEYESQWQPRHTAARLLRQPTTCSPCYAFTCPYHLECLDIPPEHVVEAGLALLKTSLLQPLLNQ